MEKVYTPKYQSWNAGKFLVNLTRNDIVLPDSAINELRDFFWNAMITEYDAENFCNFLKTINYQLSPEFQAFEKVWRRDEYNHYLDFRYLFSILYAESENIIMEKIANVEPDFSPIEKFLNDEFKVCLILAYDEIATTKSYISEYDLYKSFGHPIFYEWIKNVARDESYHFHNCLKIIELNHPDRIAEIPETLDTIIAHDKVNKGYANTFIMDHYWYSDDFKIECGRIINDHFKHLFSKK